MESYSRFLAENVLTEDNVVWIILQFLTPRCDPGNERPVMKGD